MAELALRFTKYILTILNFNFSIGMMIFFGASEDRVNKLMFAIMSITFIANMVVMCV